MISKAAARRAAIVEGLNLACYGDIAPVAKPSEMVSQRRILNSFGRIARAAYSRGGKGPARVRLDAARERVIRRELRFLDSVFFCGPMRHVDADLQDIAMVALMHFSKKGLSP